MNEEIIKILEKDIEESKKKVSELLEIQRKTNSEISKSRAEVIRKEKAKNLYLGKKMKKKKELNNEEVKNE